MNFRNRLKASMRGAKAKTHRLLMAYRARIMFGFLRAMMAVSSGVFHMSQIKSTRAATKEDRANKAMAMASCVIETHRAVYSALCNSAETI